MKKNWDRAKEDEAESESRREDNKSGGSLLRFQGFMVIRRFNLGASTRMSKMAEKLGFHGQDEDWRDSLSSFLSLEGRYLKLKNTQLLHI